MNRSTAFESTSYKSSWNSRDVHRWNNAAAGAVGLIANAVLVALLAAVHNGHIRRYALVLLVSSVVDAGLALTIFVLPTVEFEFADGRLYTIIGYDTVTWLPYASLLVYLFFLAAINFISPLVFIFRYEMMVRQREQLLRRILTIAGVVVALSAHQSLLMTLAIALNRADHLTDCGRLQLEEFWRPKAGDPPTICVSSAPYSKLLIYTSAVAMFGMSTAYGIMIYTTIAIVRSMDDAQLRLVSKRTRQLHRQLNTVLIVQMLLPFVFEFLPSNTIVINMIIGRDCHGLALITQSVTVWLPVINPLSTTLLVGPLRRLALRTASRALPVRLRQSESTAVDSNATATNMLGGRRGTSPMPISSVSIAPK